MSRLDWFADPGGAPLLNIEIWFEFLELREWVVGIIGCGTAAVTPVCVCVGLWFRVGFVHSWGLYCGK